MADRILNTDAVTIYQDAINELFKTWRPLFSASGGLEAAAAGAYVLTNLRDATVAWGSATHMNALYGFAGLAPAGCHIETRMVVTAMPNDVAPGRTFSVELRALDEIDIDSVGAYPKPGSWSVLTAATVAVPLLSAITGATAKTRIPGAAVDLTAAVSENHLLSVDILVNGGAMAADSAVMFIVDVQYRIVVP